VQPIRPICGRFDLMNPPQSKLRAALAGLAVIVVVGLATPSVLGSVTVSLWSRSGVFDVNGSTRLALFILVAVAWMAWLRIIVGLCLDVLFGLRHPNNAPRAAGLRGYLAGWVLGFALLVLPGTAMGAGLAGATTAAAPISAPLPATTEVASPTSLNAPIQPKSSGPSAVSPVVSATPMSASTVSTSTVSTYTVVSGDCLSTIALRFYGDEGAWNEIWAANANRVMADGMRFGDPNLIYPGWVLVLPGLPGTSPTEPMPTDPTPSSSTDPPASKPVPPPSAAPQRANGQRGGSGLGESGPEQTKARSAPTTNPAPAQPRRGQASVSAPGEAGTPHGASSSAEALVAAGSDALTRAVVRWLPESASLGISVLVAAAYVRRIRRRRAQARAARGDDEAVADPDPAAVRLESRLAPFADAPVLEWLELANRHLTSALRAEERHDPPRTRIVRVGPAGVEVLLEDPVDWAPGSFALGHDGKSWRLPADVDRALLWPDACEELAWLPLLLPVGDDATGTYLLHLEPGAVASLEGPGAPSMLASWVEAAKSWPWAEQVGVARDTETAEALAPLFVGQTTLDERATVLFTGDPGVLSEAARTIVASVTSSPSLAATRVVVSAQEAIIEPFGITVQACRLDSASESALAGLDGPCAVRVVAEENQEPRESSEGMGGGETTPRSPAELIAADPIEVRLLTFTPEIVGLAEPLPSNMAVRITELVAWLALQGTKGTTSASMLDHGIVGATSTKTLYNVVSAARAALGTDASGASRLIADRSTGTYRLADDVTVDVLRFVQMAERGIDIEDPHEAAELCRAALQLIDDTPVGNGSGRYGWWSSMWEARIGRLATKAAGRLGELARHGVIDLEIARTGIERARLAADGEGELHRVAMVLEAWAGNDERVEREWQTACAQAEELEAGSVPGAATESLLVATRRRRSGAEQRR
jgi:hypothetical protein